MGMLILNAMVPIFILLLLGSLFRKLNITNESFLKTSDKLVYYIFFPVMLFWEIGNASSEMGDSLTLCIAAIIAVVLVYLASLITIKLFRIPHYQAGSFSQACYRFNTYIGMAVVMNALGEEGVKYFGILIGIAIPIINVMAVSTLIWFSREKQSLGKSMSHLLKALISNPLILGCITGILFSKSSLAFPTFLDNTFSLMTSVTMPLALISIGGSLTLKGLKNNLLIAFLATDLKLILLPLTGYFLLAFFDITGIPFKVGMIFFTLPTSTAIYVLSAQLNSDTQMASAAIMMSTLVSFISLSIALLM